MADEIKTGLAELSKLLSEPLAVGELSKIPGPQPRIGVTELWKEALKQGWTAVYFDFEMKKPPDKPITP